jgi:hypothetical protein
MSRLAGEPLMYGHPKPLMTRRIRQQADSCNGSGTDLDKGFHITNIKIEINSKSG